MVLEQIANLSVGVIRLLGSSPSHSANKEEGFESHRFHQTIVGWQSGRMQQPAKLYYHPGFESQSYFHTARLV